MRELGIDLSGRRPQLLTRELAEQADVVVTMGCGDACPYIPGKRYIDWDLPDPNGRPIVEVRDIRDDIAQRVTELAATSSAQSRSPCSARPAFKRPSPDVRRARIAPR